MCFSAACLGTDILWTLTGLPGGTRYIVTFLLSLSHLGSFFGSHSEPLAYAAGIAGSHGITAILGRTNIAATGMNADKLFAFGVDMCVFTSRDAIA